MIGHCEALSTLSALGSCCCLTHVEAVAAAVGDVDGDDLDGVAAVLLVVGDAAAADSTDHVGAVALKGSILGSTQEICKIPLLGNIDLLPTMLTMPRD